MAIAPNPVSPYRSVDTHGRALPMTEDEILERNAEAIRALDGRPTGSGADSDFRLLTPFRTPAIFRDLCDSSALQPSGRRLRPKE